MLVVDGFVVDKNFRDMKIFIFFAVIKKPPKSVI